MLPDNLKQYTSPGFDVEWLPFNNILFVLPLKGVYEVNRDGDIVWSYLDSKVSHDADLRYQHDPEVLPDGNILVANHRKPHTAIEIDPETGQILWRYVMRRRETWPVRDADRFAEWQYLDYRNNNVS